MKWIKVEDQLPPLNQWGNSNTVIVVVTGYTYTDVWSNELKSRSIEPKVTFGSYQQGTWTAYGTETGWPVVSHWMPLPEVPEESEVAK